MKYQATKGNQSSFLNASHYHAAAPQKHQAKEEGRERKRTLGLKWSKQLGKKKKFPQDKYEELRKNLIFYQQLVVNELVVEMVQEEIDENGGDVELMREEINDGGESENGGNDDGGSENGGNDGGGSEGGGNNVQMMEEIITQQIFPKKELRANKYEEQRWNLSMNQEGSYLVEAYCQEQGIINPGLGEQIFEFSPEYTRNENYDI